MTLQNAKLPSLKEKLETKSVVISEETEKETKVKITKKNNKK